MWRYSQRKEDFTLKNFKTFIRTTLTETIMWFLFLQIEILLSYVVLQSWSEYRYPLILSLVVGVIYILYKVIKYFVKEKLNRKKEV